MNRLQEIYLQASSPNVEVMSPVKLTVQDTAQIDALDKVLTEMSDDRYQFSIEVNRDTMDMVIAVGDDRRSHGVFIPFSVKNESPDKSAVVVDGDCHKPAEFTFPSDNEIFARFLANEYVARVQRQNRALAIMQHLSGPDQP